MVEEKHRDDRNDIFLQFRSTNTLIASEIMFVIIIDRLLAVARFPKKSSHTNNHNICTFNSDDYHYDEISIYARIVEPRTCRTKRDVPRGKTVALIKI